MTQDQIKEKIQEINKERNELVVKVKDDMAKKQEEFNSFIKESQRSIDRLEGQLVAYQSILEEDTRPEGDS